MAGLAPIQHQMPQVTGGTIGLAPPIQQAPAPMSGGSMATAQPPMMNAPAPQMATPIRANNPYSGSTYTQPSFTAPNISAAPIAPPAISTPIEPQAPQAPQMGGLLQQAQSPQSTQNQFQPQIAEQGSNSMADFDQFRDSSYDQAMRQLNPQMDAQNRRFDQQMNAQGIQAGTQAYDDAFSNMSRGQNDLMSQASFGSQQAGLQAQGQFAGQDIQRQGLANQYNIAGMNNDTSRFNAQTGANASMANALTGANASMANARSGSDASRYGADQRYNLGQMQMAENGRQFNDSNQLNYDRMNQSGQQFNDNLGLQYGQLDSQNMMGLGNLLLGNRQQDLSDWQAQQGANNQWWNQIGAVTNNAPGVSFNPISDVAGNMQNAGQNMANAQAQQNAATQSALTGMLGMFSDKRLKENIVWVDKVKDVNVYEFDYINKKLGKDRFRGVMAQEIKELYPNAVNWVKGFMSVDYSQLPINMEIV